MQIADKSEATDVDIVKTQLGIASPALVMDRISVLPPFSLHMSDAQTEHRSEQASINIVCI